MGPAQAVCARGLGKWFGDVVALDGVDLCVAEGEIHGLVGPNGAGKTTLLGLLLGLATADRGELTVLGRDVGRTRTVPAGVAGFVDGPGLYPSLTPRRNLRALADLRGQSAGGIDAVLAEVGLTDVADDPVRGFSLGMRQRLGLAAALLTAPRLLVLDEPANGLDPSGTRQVHRILTRLAAEGIAVVLSSHRMDDLTTLCARVSLLNRGRVVFTGTVDRLAAEHGAVDYLIRTPEPARAGRLAAALPTVRLLPTEGIRTSDALVVRTREPGLDELVRVLVGAGVPIRALAPVVAPLEAAYLALTSPDDLTAPDDPAGYAEPEADRDRPGPDSGRPAAEAAGLLAGRRP